MKLDDFCVDLEQEDLARLNSPDTFKKGMNIDDAKLSMDLPIVVKYDYVDLGETDYNFMQEFTIRDTQEYFKNMKEISSSTINELIEKSKNDKNYHFFRSTFSGNVRREIKKIMPDADENLIVYHFGLYECESHNANRETGERSPRVYFLLGNNGFIYIVFFDPYHELNPMP